MVKAHAYLAVLSEISAPTIVFAKNKSQALSKIEKILGAYSKDVTVETAPMYDNYRALGYVPPFQLLDDRWPLECLECGMKIDMFRWNYEKNRPLQLVATGPHLFCSPGCSYQHIIEAKQAKQRQEDAKSLILERYPWALNLSACGGYPGYPVYVDFYQPNGESVITWKSSDPELLSMTSQDAKIWRERQKEEAVLKRAISI